MIKLVQSCKHNHYVLGGHIHVQIHAKKVMSFSKHKIPKEAPKDLKTGRRQKNSRPAVHSKTAALLPPHYNSKQTNIKTQNIQLYQVSRETFIGFVRCDM